MRSAKLLLECTLDMSKPTEEMLAMITTVIEILPSMKCEILEGLDIEVAQMLADIE